MPFLMAQSAATLTLRNEFESRSTVSFFANGGQKHTSMVAPLDWRVFVRSISRVVPLRTGTDVLRLTGCLGAGAVGSSGDSREKPG